MKEGRREVDQTSPVNSRKPRPNQNRTAGNIGPEKEYLSQPLVPFVLPINKQTFTDTDVQWRGNGNNFFSLNTQKICVFFY